MQVKSESLEVSLRLMLPQPPGSHLEGMHIEIPLSHLERFGISFSESAEARQSC